MSDRNKVDKFKKDIEKYPFNFDDEEDKDDRKSFSLLLKVVLGVVAVWVIIGLAGFDMKTMCMKNSGKNGHSEIKTSSPNEFRSKSGSLHSEMNLVDVNTITANNEYEKLSNEQQKNQNTKGTITQISTSDVDPQNDLKEIFSVSPVVIFSSNDKSKQQKELENIFLLELSIVPEPKVVDLLKHPRYDQIIDYLTSYSTHEQNLVNGGTTNLDYEHDSEVEDDNIPRVFLGGVPIGNYKQITRKFNDNELLGYLKDIGQGLISVS